MKQTPVCHQFAGPVVCGMMQYMIGRCAGFGSPCTLAAVSLPWMVGEGLMSTFFPLVRPTTQKYAYQMIFGI